MGSWLEKGIRKAEDDRLRAQRVEREREEEIARQKRIAEQALQEKYENQRRIRQELSERVDHLIASLPIDEAIDSILEMFPDASVLPYRDFPDIGHVNAVDLSRVKGIIIQKSTPWKIHEGGGYSSETSRTYIGPGASSEGPSYMAYFPKYKYKTRKETLASISLGGRVYVDGVSDAIIGLRTQSRDIRLDDTRFVLFDKLEMPTSPRYSIYDSFKNQWGEQFSEKRYLETWKGLEEFNLDYWSGIALADGIDPAEAFKNRVIEVVDKVRQL